MCGVGGGWCLMVVWFVRLSAACIELDIKQCNCFVLLIA